MSAKTSHSVRDARKPGWFYLDGALITRYGPTIGAYGVAIYAVLAHKAAESNSNCAIIGYDSVAALIRIARNTVIRTLRDMETAGVIAIEQQTDDHGRAIGANIYTLCAIASDQKAVSHQEGVPLQGTPVPTQGTPHAAQGTGGYPQVDGGGTPTGMRHDQYHIESDSNTPTTTAHEASNGVVVGDDFYLELRKRRVGQTKARQIASMGGDSAHILSLIDNRPNANDPSSLGNLINDITDGVASDMASKRVRDTRPTATRPNLPEAIVTPAEVLRHMRERNGSS